jgi:lysozyme
MSFKSRLVAGAAAALTATGILAVTMTEQLEGNKLRAYRDIVGVPTVCAGETLGVRIGDIYTAEECQRINVKALIRHEQGMVKCINADVLDRIPDKSYVAFLLFTYNVGTGGFCNSTAKRLINTGTFSKACDAMSSWNKVTAGGKKVVSKGLVNRRAKEVKLCHQGLAEGAPIAPPVPVPVPRPEPAPPPVVAAPKPVAPVASPKIPAKSSAKKCEGIYWFFGWCK